MSDSCCTVLIVGADAQERCGYADSLTSTSQQLYTILQAEQLSAALSMCQQVNVDCVLLCSPQATQEILDFSVEMRKNNDAGATSVVLLTDDSLQAQQAWPAETASVVAVKKHEVDSQRLYQLTQDALQRLAMAHGVRTQAWENKRVDAALGDSNAYFRLLVESVSEYAIIMLSPQGAIDSWNVGATQMFGWHDREIIGQNVRCLYGSNDEAAAPRTGQLQAANTQQHSEKERWYKRRDGSQFYASGAMAPLMDGVGFRRGHSLVVRDLTNETQVATALQQLHQTTEVFFDRASHELRTPIAGLQLHLECLQRALPKLDPTLSQPLAQRVQVAVRLAQELGDRVGALLPPAPGKILPAALRKEV